MPTKLNRRRFPGGPILVRFVDNKEVVSDIEINSPGAASSGSVTKPADLGLPAGLTCDEYQKAIKELS